MRLRIKHKWRSDATYNKGERRWVNRGTPQGSAWIKNRATREDRRNARELIRFELINGGRDDK
jgi:hypothetical protein